MQSSSFQSVPCNSPEEAAASAAAMAALATPKGMEHRVVSTVVQDVNGLFIAIVVVELTPLEEGAAAEQRPEENRQGEPISGENDAPDNVYWLAGFNTREMEGPHLFPDTTPSAPDAASAPATDIAAAPQPHDDGMYTGGGIYLHDAPTGPQTLSDEAPQLAEQLRTDFNEEPAATAPAPEDVAAMANLAPDPADDDEDEGEGGGEDGRGRARDVAENQSPPPSEEPAPALPA